MFHFTINIRVAEKAFKFQRIICSRSAKMPSHPHWRMTPTFWPAQPREVYFHRPDDESHQQIAIDMLVISITEILITGQI